MSNHIIAFPLIWSHMIKTPCKKNKKNNTCCRIGWATAFWKIIKLIYIVLYFILPCLWVWSNTLQKCQCIAHSVRLVSCECRWIYWWIDVHYFLQQKKKQKDLVNKSTSTCVSTRIWTKKKIIPAKGQQLCHMSATALVPGLAQTHASCWAPARHFLWSLDWTTRWSTGKSSLGPPVPGLSHWLQPAGKIIEHLIT